MWISLVEHVAELTHSQNLTDQCLDLHDTVVCVLGDFICIARLYFEHVEGGGRLLLFESTNVPSSDGNKGNMAVFSHFVFFRPQRGVVLELLLHVSCVEFDAKGILTLQNIGHLLVDFAIYLLFLLHLLYGKGITILLKLFILELICLTLDHEYGRCLYCIIHIVIYSGVILVYHYCDDIFL